jgi:D-alanine-D-alanine ligase
MGVLQAMALRIGFAYNEKPAEEEEPPSSASHDRFAEWDDPTTIAAVAHALGLAGTVIPLEADEDFPASAPGRPARHRLQHRRGAQRPQPGGPRPGHLRVLRHPLHRQRPPDPGPGPGQGAHQGGPGGPGDPDATLDRGGWARGEPERKASAVSGHREAPLRGLQQGNRQRLPPVGPEVHPGAGAVGGGGIRPAGLVEEFLPGREFTVAVLGNGPGARVLPPVEIRFDSLPEGAPALYGWEAKWVWDTPEAPLSIFECPAPVDAGLLAALEKATLGAYHALGCRDWARIDLRLDAAGEPHVLEVNALPGILAGPPPELLLPQGGTGGGAGLRGDDPGRPGRGAADVWGWWGCRGARQGWCGRVGADARAARDRCSRAHHSSARLRLAGARCDGCALPAGGA